MINPKELRIGNLLKCGDKIVEVEDIGDTGINLQWMHEMSGFDYDYGQLAPIELSPEWLEKLGFNRFANGAYHRNEMRTWRIWYDDYEKAVTYCTDIYQELGHAVYLPIRLEYVHQLQNIYFMMNEVELELKNK